MAQKTDNVGIGTTKPDASALLDLNSTSKGLLLPRMSEAQRNAIKNPAAGLVIFQTDKAVGTYTFDGTAWQPSSARTAATQVAGAWDKQGNAIDGTDFLGSTNAFPLVFKTNNVRTGSLDLLNNVYFGAATGNTTGTVGYNVGLGFTALTNITTGSENIGIGAEALTGNTTGGSNIAIGSRTLKSNTTTSGSAGTYNVAIGSDALRSNTTGDYNFALGPNALLTTSTGSYNFAVGGASLYSLNSGSSNFALGVSAMENVTSGDNNTAIGTLAGRNASGSGNLFIGYQAGTSSTGDNKLFISNNASNTPLIGGDFANNNLKFHTGTASPTATAGFVAIGDFATATGSTAGAGGINSFPTFTAGSKYRLVVQDGILTEKLKVALRNGAEWADYVFAPEYKLMSLEDVEKYTKVNKHLPNVPSADEMATKGLDVSEVSKMFMEKIEELTLHVIELNKRIKELEAKK